MPNAMPDEYYLAHYLRAAADYAEAPHGAGLVHIAPQTATRHLLPRCMWPAEARHLAYLLTAHVSFGGLEL